MLGDKTIMIELEYGSVPKRDGKHYQLKQQLPRLKIANDTLSKKKRNILATDKHHMYIASDRPKNDTLVLLRPQDRQSVQEMSMQSFNS